MEQNIDVFTDENDAGGESFTFTRIGNLRHELITVNGRVTKSISLLESAVSYTAKFKQGSLRFKTRVATKNNDQYKKHTLSFKIPKDRADLRVMFDVLERNRYLIIYTDNNGQRTVLGNKGQGCLFSYSIDHGTDGGFNGYDCSFEFASRYNVPIIKEEVSTPTTPLNDEDADTAFEPFG